MGSGHGVRGKNPKRSFTESQEMVLLCARRTKMVAEVKGALAFGLSHHFIAARVIWAVTVNIMSSKIIECTNGPH
jgi:predicted molibdopterin-dependent oxidoreductase YjgC